MIKKIADIKKITTFAALFQKNDSLAQQVEHIPFKDGVLGSNPRRITIIVSRFFTPRSIVNILPLYLSAYVNTTLGIVRSSLKSDCPENVSTAQGKILSNVTV